MHALLENQFPEAARIAIRRRSRPKSPVHDDDLIRAPALIKLLFCLHHFFLVGP
ncbi:hypothetical protein G3N95_09100 [Paraburkholderia sp. Tr-20389]|uniref:hypothetical protein n=1 Tax=Paraburkholderia sp. Tr-20389 TaxID=2703903 RepID=UPI001980661A|nr:hypothetical protein [Paraburkholderia sp. Tr-20389]MBN3753099.1 hypothetical protein [Paraburkholderia sp. Tr-20389]